MTNRTPPNILFILIDDMGWRDLGCYGSTFYETPNIDALAAESMVFTDAYAACPVCSPTRASILSGRYPARVGLTDWIDVNKWLHPCRGRLVDAPYIDHLPSEEVSLAQALRDGGYQTWHAGKWHLGGPAFYPEKHGFDVNVGGSDWGHPMHGYFSPYEMPNLTDGPENEYLTDRLTDEVIALIEGAGEQPFFLHLSHYAVHTPIEAKPDDVERFRAKAAASGLDKQPALAEGDWYPTENKRHLRILRRIVQSDPVYAAMVYNLDWNIGRLLGALDASGKRDNTMVVFTSDNGGLATSESSPTCNAPLCEGKGWMYEGGVREPLIVRWPGVTEGGSICSEPVTSPDFYPTFLEAADLPLRPKQHADGVSLLPLLHGEASLDRDALFWHYPHYGNQGGTPGSSIRCGDHKLIEFFEDGRLELYNLRDDLSETRDLAHEEPELADTMQRKLAGWREAVEAKLPTKNPDYQERKR